MIHPPMSLTHLINNNSIGRRHPRQTTIHLYGEFSLSSWTHGHVFWTQTAPGPGIEPMTFAVRRELQPLRHNDGA